MTEAARLNVVLDARITQFEKKVATAERRMTTAARKMERDGKGIDKTFAKIGGSSGKASVMIDNFARSAGISLGGISLAAGGAALSVAAIGLAARSAVRAGEDMKRLKGQLTALTGSAERAGALIGGMFDIADETGIALQSIGQIQNRMLLAAESIGGTDAQVGTLTDNILKLGRVGGSSTSDITNGSIQLAQALASGVLQGDELRSIMENMPLLAKSIAEGLGVGVGQLKQMGSEGQLTADKVFGALLSQTGKINEAFKVLDVTSDVAMGRLSAAMVRVGAAIDDNIGLSNAWTSALGFVADAANEAADSFEMAAKRRAAWSTRPMSEVEADIASGEANLARYKSRGWIGDASNALAQEAKLNRLYAERARLLQDIARASVGRGGAGPGWVAPTKAGPDGEIRNAQLAAYYGSYGAGKLASGTMPKKATASSGGGSSTQSNEVARLTSQLNDLARALETQRGAIGLSGVALARYNATARVAETRLRAMEAAAERGIDLSPAEIEAIEAKGAAYIAMAESVAAATDAEEAALAAGERVKEQQEEMIDVLNGVAGAFVDVATGTQSWEQALGSLAKQILNMPSVQSGMGDLFSKLLGTAASAAFGGISGGSIGGSPYTVSPTGSFSGLYASGGVTQPGKAYMVGERGPEPFVPSSAGRVLSVPQAQAAVSGGGGGTTIIQYSPSISGVGASVEQVAAMLAEQGRQVGKMAREQSARGI